MIEDRHMGAPGEPGRAAPASAVEPVSSPVSSKASIPSADEAPYWEYDDEECANCGGEGFTYGCSWDWQCDSWDGESCLCTRRCEWCTPAKPNPELQAVLADALAAQGTEAGTAKTACGLGPKDDGPVAESDAPNPSPHQGKDHD